MGDHPGPAVCPSHSQGFLNLGARSLIVLLVLRCGWQSYLLRAPQAFAMLSCNVPSLPQLLQCWSISQSVCGWLHELPCQVKCHPHFTDWKQGPIFSNMRQSYKSKQVKELNFYISRPRLSILSLDHPFLWLYPAQRAQTASKRIFLYELHATLSKAWHKRDKGVSHYCPHPFH